MKLNKQQNKIEKELNKNNLFNFLGYFFSIVGVIIIFINNDNLEIKLIGVSLILLGFNFFRENDIYNIENYLINKKVKGG